jgi:hypothetical protein
MGYAFLRVEGAVWMRTRRGGGVSTSVKRGAACPAGASGRAHDGPGNIGNEVFWKSPYDIMVPPVTRTFDAGVDVRPRAKGRRRIANPPSG